MRCEVVSYCSCVIVSGLLGLCWLSCFGKILRCFPTPTICYSWCASNLGGLCLFSLFYWLWAEKVCLWAVPLFTGNEKKRKLKQPLNNLYFGLPLSGGTSCSWRILLRHLKGLFTELIGLLKTLHWSHFFRSQGPFQTLFPQRKITSHFSTASQKWSIPQTGTSRLAHLAGQTKELFQLSFFKSHFCSTFSLGFNNTRETLVEI